MSDENGPSPGAILKSHTEALLRLNNRLTNIETFCRGMITAGDSSEAFFTFLAEKHELSKKFAEQVAEAAAAEEKQVAEAAVTEGDDEDDEDDEETEAEGKHVVGEKDEG